MDDSKKGWLSLAIIVFFCLAAFAAGAVISGKERWFTPIIALHIANNTGSDLRELRIQTRTDYDEMKLTRNNIPNGDVVTIEMLAVAGGLEYSAEATLPSGRVTERQADYVTGREASFAITAQ